MSKKEPIEQPETNQEAPMVDQAFEDTANTAEGETLANTQDGLESLQAQYDELKDKYLRLFAEFENYKKRTLKERIDLMKSATQDTMTALLPVLDDFDRARQTAELSEGIQLVYQKLVGVLKQKSLEPMESTGQPFDPELHEALTEIPAPTDDLKGKIIDTIEKGYKLGEKIIRHAKVVVGK